MTTCPAKGVCGTAFSRLPRRAIDFYTHHRVCDAKQKRRFLMDKKQNLQDTFLNAVRKARTPLTIFLVNGVKLQGYVTWFDNFCVLLRRDSQIQMVYKHAISTIMPGGPVQLFDEAQDTGDED